MYAAIIVAVAMLGQSCVGGSCPSPGPQRFQLLRNTNRSDWPAEARKPYAWHWTKHEGRTFPAWGIKLSDGRIEWNPDLPDNIKQFEKYAPKNIQPTDVIPEVARPAEPEQTPDGDRLVNKGLNFGLNTQKIAESTGGYTSTSKEATDFAYEAQANTVNGDRYYLTAIGDESETAKVRASFDGPEFEAVRNGVWFGEYKKNDWQVKTELGYSAENGKPTILLQAPSGRVIYRAFDFTAGAGPIINALRKADPNYDPAKDPGPERRPSPKDPLLTPGRLALAVGALFLLILLLPRRKQ